MNGPFLFFSIVLMFVGLAAFEGSGVYVVMGCLALVASAFLLTISIRQGMRNAAEARLLYYTRPNRGGWLAGAVYGLVAWVAACVVLAYVNVGWLIGLGGVLMMALPLLGAVMTAMWRATAMPAPTLPR